MRLVYRWMMRPARLALVVALVASGCVRATAIGTPCVVDKDCNVKGQRCVAQPSGIAHLHARVHRADRRRKAAPSATTATPPTRRRALTCNQESFAFDAARARRCSSARTARCKRARRKPSGTQRARNSSDPAPSPTCRHAADPDSHATPRAPIRNDAHAYCTAGCARDSDCPVDMYCGADYDGVTKCLRRGFCDPCWMNDNCAGGNDACVPTSDGSARYCTKSCASRSTAAECRATSCRARRRPIRVGTARRSACTSSARASARGAICDPCRSDGDCGSGTSCITNLATGERMCTKSCIVDAQCASDKPTGCDYGPPPVNPGDPMLHRPMHRRFHAFTTRRPHLLLLTRRVCKFYYARTAHNR